MRETTFQRKLYSLDVDVDVNLRYVPRNADLVQQAMDQSQCIEINSISLEMEHKNLAPS